MAIDDPVGLVLRQIHEEIEADSYLPTRLTKLGLSLTAVAALAQFPLVSQIISTLLANSPARFEKRLLRVLTELHKQQQRIEDKIVDKSYYESEEFQTFLGLLLERLHTTHDDEKLKMFGDALANSASVDFKEDPREDFIRILRELSIADLQELQMFAPQSPYPIDSAWHRDMRLWTRPSRQDLKGEQLSRTARLIGFGLVNESLMPKDFNGSGYPTSREGAAQAIADAVRQPPIRSYEISRFGWRFLEFIKENANAQL